MKGPIKYMYIVYMYFSRFRCSHGSLLEGDGTDWGEWGDWSSKCQGSGICGIRTRVEEHGGIWIDDTSLNDVDMYCCE